MQLFACPTCAARLFFSNRSCHCGIDPVFDVERQTFVEGADACANRTIIGCNWRAAEGAGSLCQSCAMTQTAPDLALDDNRDHWAATEAAKRWVLANLARWGWLTARDAGPRPVFQMLAEQTSDGPARVVMGHADGVITMNVREADPALRVARRERFDEPLRTLIGHVRHEMAHFLFARLAADQRFLEAFRAVFGDERADYGAALQAYYEDGAPEQWSENHISAYASAHPHEDWAESTAHLLHLTDIVDSFLACDLSGGGLPNAGYDAYAERDATALIDAGGRLGIALNHVNRAMGLSDIYPFVHTGPIRDKINFIHGWLSAGPGGPAQAH